MFAWDDISVGPRDVFDPWVILGAMAMCTRQITLGAMVFSLARRRPWKVARESLTLDHLSNGRLVMPVGLGGTWDGGYSRVNTDHPERKIRAELLDECLEILELAWAGAPFDWNGAHCQATDLQFQPRPMNGRVPIWPVGAWPYEKSLGRCARYDGIVVSDMSGTTPEGGPISPGVVKDVAAWMEQHRPGKPAIDIIVEGTTSGTRADQELMGTLKDAGATWFIESRWEDDVTFESLHERIQMSPPRSL